MGERELTGYGYFSTVSDLEAAVVERQKQHRSLAGGARIFLGAKIVRTEIGEHLEGACEKVIFARVFPSGLIDLRAEDSLDND